MISCHLLAHLRSLYNDFLTNALFTYQREVVAFPWTAIEFKANILLSGVAIPCQVKKSK